MTMLTEAEFRAEIERLNDIIRRAAWLEQAPEEGSPYIDFESYARATEESEALRARAERYLAVIVEYVEATAAEEQAEEVYTSFGSRMMDRSLPPVTEAEVDAAFVAVATARNRAYAATQAIRAIVEEVKP